MSQQISDTELNRAAAELLGGKITALGWLNWNDDRHSIADWSPATKIEHAWLVQQSCDPIKFAYALLHLRPNPRVCCYTWLATAPPRARTEAAMEALKPTAH